MALGGSTNAHHPPHRDGGPGGGAPRPRSLRRAVARTPFLANIRPSGEYLMEDFFYAGGLRGLLARLARPAPHRLPRPSTAGRWARTSTARGLQRRRDRARARRRSGPRAASPCCAATWRPTAPSSSTPPWSRACCATPGRPSCSANYNDLEARIDDPALPVDRRLGARAAGRRPARRSRHARVGHAADPEEAARSRACATWCASPTRG